MVSKDIVSIRDSLTIDVSLNFSSISIYMCFSVRSVICKNLTWNLPFFVTGTFGAIVSTVSMEKIVTKDLSALTIGKILFVKIEAFASTRIRYILSFHQKKLITNLVEFSALEKDKFTRALRA